MWRLTVLALIATAAAQIPSLGWCPDYQPMANFSINRFLGDWYEAERYFTVSELGTRCVTTKYESTPEGRILVSNEITNSLTGMKRVMDGYLQMIGREGEGRMIVKYSSLPIPYDNEFSILDTDYDSYAVMWSCSGIGPVHIQNAWVLTRERLAPPMVMQYAYAALERYKISRTFFVKTNQDDCTVLPIPVALDGKASEDNNEDEDAKSAVVVPVVEEKKSEVLVPSVEKMVQPEVKPEMPQERSAVPEMAEEAKPAEMPMKETPMKETDEKDMKISNELENMNRKEDMMPAATEVKDKMEMPMQPTQ
ncbi:apolipoprotein D-like [Epargyreus clarus]|uniref:apolipoprotein D-like n=1 Tax=Epargyreus clarus TaxID=520877 RepID=UPI003C2C5FB2